MAALCRKDIIEEILIVVLYVLMFALNVFSHS
jgi:hypothetical protein